MKRIPWIVPVLGVILAVVLMGAYSLGRPRLLSVVPAAGAQNVPAASPIWITFSRPMKPETVLERLSITPAQSGQFRWEDATLVFEPDGLWPSGASVEVRLEGGAEIEGLLPLTLREGSQWSFTIGHPRLLYLYPANGPSNLRLYDPLSRETLDLTQNRVGLQDFHANPSGTRVYLSARTGESGSALYRLDLAQAEAAARAGADLPSLQPILDCPQALCRAVQVSPDERFIAYERTAFLGENQPTFPQVWMAALPDDANAALEPVLMGQEDHQTLQPIWSPTGRLTFYDTNALAFIFLNPDSRQEIRFLNQTGQPGNWTPTGDKYVAPEISFLGPTPGPDLPELETLASSHLILFDPQTLGEQDLTQAENLEDTSPAFAPDGSRLVFARKYLDVSRWTPGRQLWVMQPDGQAARPLTDEPYYNHFNFDWSPDSKDLAFVRFNQTVLTEPPEVWMMEMDTGASERLVVGGYAPQWIP